MKQPLEATLVAGDKALSADTASGSDVQPLEDPLREWLVELNIDPAYAANFAREEITLEMVHLLDEQDFKDLGVHKMGPRKKLMEASRLKEVEMASTHTRRKQHGEAS